MSAPVEGWGTKTRWGGEAIGAWSMGSTGDVDGGRGYSWCSIATLGTILMIGSGGAEACTCLPLLMLFTSETRRITTLRLHGE